MRHRLVRGRGSQNGRRISAHIQSIHQTVESATLNDGVTTDANDVSVKILFAREGRVYVSILNTPGGAAYV